MYVSIQGQCHFMMSKCPKIRLQVSVLRTNVPLISFENESTRVSLFLSGGASSKEDGKVATAGVMFTTFAQNCLRSAYSTQHLSSRT